ncbi:MAG: diacylglycerol kinase family protein [Gemmatimonadaceae bacterium]
MIPAFVNPQAGGGGPAVEALKAAGAFDVREVPPASLASEIRKAVKDGARRVLVAGGDGSMSIAASVLAGTDIELAILPAGTLNHLAKDLSIPLDLADAARVAVHGKARSVDAATVNGRIFLNTSAVGTYVSFVRTRERLEKRLPYGLSSVLAAAKLIVRMPTFPITIEVEGQTRTYVTPLVFIGVGERELKLPSLGARVPGGKAGLHVMVIRRRSGARALAFALAAAARGTEAMARTPALDSFIVESCRVEPKMHMAAVDGEIVRMHVPLEYRHVPGCLRVVVPLDDDQRK